MGDAVIIRFPGAPAPVVRTLPPLVTTEPVLNLCDEPTVSGRCISLVKYGKTTSYCHGLLAYQGGAWQHVNACDDCFESDRPCPDGLGHRSCDDPQPAPCGHEPCPDTADVGVPCTNGGKGSCCGCCWTGGNELDGRALWPVS